MGAVKEVLTTGDYIIEILSDLEASQSEEEDRFLVGTLHNLIDDLSEPAYSLVVDHLAQEITDGQLGLNTLYLWDFDLYQDIRNAQVRARTEVLEGRDEVILEYNLGRETVYGSDVVSSPSHYTKSPAGMECIDITKHMNFCLGSAVKYIWRCGGKGDGIEDLRKAIQFIEFEIDRIESPGSEAGAWV